MIQKDKKNNDCFQENKTLSNVLEASIPELMWQGWGEDGREADHKSGH